MLKADLGFTDSDGESKSLFQNADLTFSGLEGVLLKYGKLIASKSADNLRNNKFGKDSNATGQLEQSIQVSPVKLFGSDYVVEISMNRYWEWANDGRSPGKRPPVSAIRQWIIDKKLRLDDGGTSKGGYKKPGTLIGSSSKKVTLGNRKVSILDATAYKIASKIGKFGTKGTSFVTDAVAEVRDEFLKEVKKAIGKDIEINIKK